MKYGLFKIFRDFIGFVFVFNTASVEFSFKLIEIEFIAQF